MWTELEGAVYQEAETETDCDEDRTNSEWYDRPGEVEAVGGWDSQAAEASYDWGGDSSDSGYGSDDTEPDCPEAIKYKQLPYRTKHYLQNYVQRILEATSYRYGREHRAADLSDLEWKRKNLQFPGSNRAPDRLVHRDWLAEDEIELEYWMDFFARIHIPDLGYTFGSAKNLRHRTVHRNRGDGGELTWECLSYAMELPAKLGYSKAQSEIDNACKFAMEDPTLDESTRAEVEDAMYTPPPCTNRYQLLGRIQTLLEETCFNYARREIPDVLTRAGFDMPEQVELPVWADIFRNQGIKYDDSAKGIFPEMDPCIIFRLLQLATRDIRNIVAHRSPLSDAHVVTQVHCAIYLCILQADWNQAVEIEVLAEMFFTDRSRAQVLDRLASVYRNGSIGSLYERERRVAVRGFLNKAGHHDGDDGDGALVVVGDDAEGSAPTVVEGSWDLWDQRTWSLSMHECLLRLEDKFAN